MADFQVEHAHWSLDHAALKALRKTVFIDEQAVPEDEEWDDHDPACEHVLALTGDGTPIGCGRLTPQHKIGRMAVLRELRGRGVGAAMLALLIERARSHGWPEVTLHAQTSALEFYRKHGFESFGPRFMEAGIEHQGMRKAIPPPSAPPSQRGKPPRRPEPRALECSTPEGLRREVLGLLQQARHGVRLHSAQLQPLLADDDTIATELRRVASSGRHADIRILVLDPDLLLRSGHRLIGLAQRLETAIQVRSPGEREDRRYPSAFLVNDVGGYLLQPRADQPRAFGSTRAPGRHRNLANYFDEVWQRSQPATAWRKLDL